MEIVLSNSIIIFKDLEEFAEYSGLHIEDVNRFIDNGEFEEFNLMDLNGMGLEDLAEFINENIFFNINGTTYIDRT